MKKTNLQSLLIIAVSIILLSSCSQVRQITTSSNHKLHLVKADRNTTATTKVESSKVIDKKELNSLPVKDHEISALLEEKNSETKLRPVKSPALGALINKESKTDTKSESGNKNLQRVDKAFIHLDKIINETSSSGNNEKKLLPYGHYDANRLLWLWIVTLVLDIIFWVLFAVTLAAFFGFLSFLFGVAALVFFIIWLVTINS